MKIVREHIVFTRGGDPYKKLDVGNTTTTFDIEWFNDHIDYFERL